MPSSFVIGGSPRSQVDDREPVLADRAATLHERPLGIRPAVALTRELCPNDVIGSGPRLPSEPGNSAHAA